MDEVLEQHQENENNDILTEERVEYASKEEVAEELENVYKNIEDFHKRLLYFTLSKIRYYFNADTFRDTTAEDVVQIVLETIIQLKRKWYRDRFPDFHKFVRLAILSYIRNECKKKVKIETIDLYDENGSLSEKTIKELISDYSHEDAAEKYFRTDLECLIQKFTDDLEDDIYAFFVLEKRLDGAKSNIEIADKLGIEVREVENAIKRIKNKFQKLLKK